MRPITLILSLLTALLAMADETPLATLIRVTSAEEILSDGQYIFCRNGRALIESASSPIPSTDVWRTDSLAGDELYLWTLLPLGANEFYIIGHYGLYLSNPKSNELKSTTSQQTRWTFEFAEDSTAMIRSANDRFIGEKTAFSGQYIAPAYSNRSYYPHDFIIYRLAFPQPEEPKDPEDPEETESTALSGPSLQGEEQGRLFLHNGTFLILRNSHTYTLTGRQLR